MVYQNRKKTEAKKQKKILKIWNPNSKEDDGENLYAIIGDKGIEEITIKGRTFPVLVKRSVNKIVDHFALRLDYGALSEDLRTMEIVDFPFINEKNILRIISTEKGYAESEEKIYFILVRATGAETGGGWCYGELSAQNLRVLGANYPLTILKKRGDMAAVIDCCRLHGLYSEDAADDFKREVANPIKKIVKTSENSLKAEVGENVSPIEYVRKRIFKNVHRILKNPEIEKLYFEKMGLIEFETEEKAKEFENEVHLDLKSKANFFHLLCENISLVKKVDNWEDGLFDYTYEELKNLIAKKTKEELAPEKATTKKNNKDNDNGDALFEIPK